MYYWVKVPREQWAKSIDHIDETLRERLGSPWVVTEMWRDLDPGRVSYATEYKATVCLQDGSEWGIGWCDMIGTEVRVMGGKATQLEHSKRTV